MLLYYYIVQLYMSYDTAYHISVLYNISALNNNKYTYIFIFTLFWKIYIFKLSMRYTYTFTHK
jgi:hypothetical protein